MTREVEMAKSEGRQASIVGLPDIEGMREQVQLEIEAEKAAKAAAEPVSPRPTQPNCQ
jgi:hypothetical protein